MRVGLSYGLSRLERMHRFGPFWLVDQTLCRRGWDIAEQHIPNLRASIEEAGAISFNALTEMKEVRTALLSLAGAPADCAILKQ